MVVDAGSTDGSRETADALADIVLEDPGTGLGRARNLGIAATTLPLVLNTGSDNVVTRAAVEEMLDCLDRLKVQGVSARTRIEGDDYLTRGLNAWRAGRFRPGPATVIGTPTLFDGDLLRAYPYDPTRRFSDDSELCERWARGFGARFAISDAEVLEVGKTSWDEVRVRCRMYGISDEEVFRHGRAEGWNLARQGQSLLHPASADFATPLRHLPVAEAAATAPFLATFAAMRYYYWAATALHRS